MGKNVDIFRQREGLSGAKSQKPVVEESNTSIVKTNTTKKTRLLSIDVLVDDLPKFDAALLKLSHRDGVLYRKRDVYLAMTKMFFDAIEKNIDKVKIEKN
jgi:hypothetical protein